MGYDIKTLRAAIETVAEYVEEVAEGATERVETLAERVLDALASLDVILGEGDPVETKAEPDAEQAFADRMNKAYEENHPQDKRAEYTSLFGHANWANWGGTGGRDFRAQ